MTIYYTSIQFINMLLFSSIGFFVYSKDRESRLHRTFLLFCLSVSGWAGCYVIWQLAGDHDSALFWVRVLNAVAIFMPMTFMHHLFVFLKIDREKVPNALIKSFYAFCFFLLAVSYTPLYVKDVSRELFFPYWPKPGPIYYLFIIYFFVSVCICYYFMKKKYDASVSSEKEQIKYVLIAMLISFLGGSTNFFLFYNIPIPPIGDFLCPVYPLTISYIILRHQMFGINVIIRKGLIYSVLIAFITSVFLAFVMVIEKFFQGLVGYQAIFVSIGVGFLLALGFNPLKDVFQKFIDRRFFRGTLQEIAFENERFHREMIKQDRMRTVARLAASMAHEIRNPLTVIKTYTDFLPERHNDSKFISDFERLVKPQIEKINLAIQQLLDFSKPRKPILKPVNIHDVIREILEFLNNDFIKNKVKAQIDFSEPAAIVLADANQMKQVFLNLFLNAIDAMPAGGVLTISNHKSGNAVEISVGDTGEGITKENLKNIFQPFFTTKAKGTGLGLSVIKDIMDQHKASISVESSAGKGTKFSLKFATVSEQ